MEIKPQEPLAIITVIDQTGLAQSLIGQKTVYDLKQKKGGGISLAWVEDRCSELAPNSLISGVFGAVDFTNPDMPGQSVRLMVDPCLPTADLIILGGGHIARPLVKLGELLGYRVVVVDDRDEFVAEGRFPEAAQIIQANFDDLERSLSFGASSYVVVVTRGHRHDWICLQQLLCHPVAYIGVIGSRRKVDLTREKLLEMGFEPSRVDAVYMPIGIDIGAETPEEIAVSIAAELIKVRRGGRAASLKIGADDCRQPQGEGATDQQFELIQRAAELTRLGTRAAMATIVKTSGSTPRRAGSRMLVLADGRIFGTVGGGSGEAMAIQAALDVIDKNQARILRVVMDKDKAAQEGMICGGSMEIFIEPAAGYTQIS